MTTLTDRYVHAVTAQLPEGQRDDIARELRATIEDTVAAAPPDTDPVRTERQVLIDLGHPTALADSYRGEGRSLIGPRLYPGWVWTLKMLLAFVPALVVVIMLVVGVLEDQTAVRIIVGAISGAFWAAISVAFWTTLGFAIAERSGAGQDDLGGLPGVAHDEWDPADLPEPRGRHVSRSEAIWSVLGNALVLVLLALPVRLGGRVEDVEWGQIFTDTAYSLRWVLAAGIALSLLASIFVLARSRWTWPSAVAHLVGGLVFLLPIVWLAFRNDLFAWETLPLGWISEEPLVINETVTLAATVGALAAILVWEWVDSFRKAARSS